MSETSAVVTPLLKAMSAMGFIVVAAPGRKPMRFSDVAHLLATQPKPLGIVWRQNTAVARYSTEGRDRLVRCGVAGMSDIAGILRDGRLLAIECKRRKGKTTAEQNGYLHCVRRMGGVGLVVTEGDDIVSALWAIRP